MEILLVLIGLPLFFAVLVMFARRQKTLAVIIRLSAVFIFAATLVFVVLHYNEIFIFDLSGNAYIPTVMLAIDILLAGFIIYMGIKHKSLFVSLLALLQIGLFAWFELAADHTAAQSAQTVYADKLSLIMIAIVGLIGSLICVYAVEYMKDYHNNHGEYKDRRRMFFSILLVFMSAMFGLVVSNDLVYLLFFWEITTVCSFLLIRYNRTGEAIKNAFLALTLNVLGGLLFTVGIVLLGVYEHVTCINGLLALDSSVPLVMASVFLIACAGLSKSAQLPFSKWLLGAMAAPTPTSAMLHSSTMVKAGVYLILRLAPMLGSNAAGITITLIGGITFFAAALLAVTQHDAKKVLAYSTISNLGLIVACAGINTSESMWAAVMLIVFHAIAKSLLFLTVGSAEHQLGGRSIEDMDGLYQISTALTMMLVVGIAGMFVAPFGMLISKWAAMKAFVDSGNIIIVMIIAFGSTITLFFWTKWMGKLVANAHRFAPTSYVMRIDEKVSLYLLAAMVIIVCALHPIISSAFIIPFIEGGAAGFVPPIGMEDTAVIIFMLLILFLFPIILMPIYTKHQVKTTSVYLSGENAGDDVSFRGSMGEIKKVELRNWYFKKLLKENYLLTGSAAVCAVIMLCGFFLAMGGLFL
ncbi:MAG: NADH-quinone oxidoreductase subunit L [Defluviitaleaceae bacterium]|nr:NADH-quinone oxidoreductase subunit L [Defluviitaleaceae bacterium]